ncbi:MAG TPA: class F sortase [Euzebyales bacterium]|nr:class F sortase [Euzebyales bacterium]
MAVPLLVSAVLLGGCGDPSALPQIAYERIGDYFDDWAARREEAPQRASDELRNWSPERGRTAEPRPVGIRLPSVGVSSRLEPLGIDRDGAIRTPQDWQRAGWYRGGPRPGDIGAAVILGHVDSTTGPAVFYRLRDLRPGDEIRVRRADDSVAVFAVDRLEQHRKTRFPTDEVYYPTPEPTLRLVTCGGDFDAQAGSYRDNLVVFATLRSIRT